MKNENERTESVKRTGLTAQLHIPFDKPAKRDLLRLQVAFKAVIAAAALSVPVLYVPGAVAFAQESTDDAYETKEGYKGSVREAEVEALRLKRDEAQAAYDAALRDKAAAEDVVENAARAARDARTEYEEVSERYATGFAGFLRWVIDTEKDPVKAEDARRVLESSFADGSDVAADNAANITRMLYMADWLEDFAQYFREVYGVEPDTSHAAMRVSQTGLDAAFADVSEWFTEAESNIFSVIESENERILPTIDSGEIKGWWHSYTGIPEEYNDGIPVIEKYEKDEWIPYYTTIVDKRNGYREGDIVRVAYENGEELYYLDDWGLSYTGDLGFMYLLNEEYDMIPDEWMTEDRLLSDTYQNAVSNLRSFMDRVSADSPNNSSVYHSNEFGELDYSLMFDDPDLLKGYDITNGITVGEAVGICSRDRTNEVMGVLFGGRGTYTVEEYVRALREYCAMTDPAVAKTVLAERNDDLDSARRELAGAESTLLQAYGRLKGADKDYEEAAALLTDQGAAIVREEEEAITEALAQEAAQEPAQEAVQEPAFGEAAAPEGDSGYAWNDMGVKVMPSDEEAVQEPALGEAVVPEGNPGYARNDMKVYEEADLYTAQEFVNSAATKGVASDEADMSAAEAENNNRILADVVSYVFNGGAIAVILPTGFLRRRKILEESL